MPNGDKNKKAEERTKRIGIRQGERTRRQEQRKNARTDRVRARHPQNESMQSTVNQAQNPNTLFENFSPSDLESYAKK